MTARKSPGRRVPPRPGAGAPAAERPAPGGSRPKPAPNGTPGRGAVSAETGAFALDLEALSRFFGAAPAWSDPAAGRYRFRVDAAAGGWLELYLSPRERLASLRVADGAVTSIHVDMTLDGVESVGVEGRGAGEPWLEVSCGREPGGTPCRVSITLQPDLLVVVDYGRR